MRYHYDVLWDRELARNESLFIKNGDVALVEDGKNRPKIIFECHDVTVITNPSVENEFLTGEISAIVEDGVIYASTIYLVVDSHKRPRLVAAAK